MSPLAAWLAAIRPRTLGLSVSPVLLGTALAFAETGRVHAGVFLATLLAALLIQIGTNLHNDVADFLRGTDTPERLGPARATAQGWLSPQAVSRAAVLAFALALVAGLFLAWVGGWPIVVLGLVSLAAGAAYSGGPWPLSSLPVGELFVFLFFGVLAVAGSHYLQTGYWSAAALLGGAILGLPAAAVLLLNNFRDRHGDARAGRRTLAILLPAPGSHRAYAVMMLAPFALLPGLLAWPAWLLPMLLLPWAWRLTRDFWHAPDGRALNPVLARTARFQFWLGVSVAVSLWPGIPA
ncbi:1,4-dihydroxy-2-naphthoate octaprenyltransferase [endosymbiont of unidentified scaly snail isolate Monju]|uniref:1,4-dihydroxy-2-naphthoate octaprenyltransferase n=1 Tax=endosymbiont of unidentified scaly snail isolate Monju TaxID=1248727 RepID=UPI0003891F5C|nr:1,4-dihydroxy-2-naphthoate octaprenyltransferase [endosymbiont of unidentified scaly snail isolate Monju]BAN68601.1 1,4-dihydroxy-2-naphthoate octaprenyltransferase [endosymbiont of unidentified scaly snail isolate Monju]